jgi:hypothetical protein
MIVPAILLDLDSAGEVPNRHIVLFQIHEGETAIGDILPGDKNYIKNVDHMVVFQRP